MKKMFFTLALSAVMLSASAQITERRMATLVETDGTKVFYGANAAIDAYDVAKDGATIILSEGEFNDLTVTGKTVKIYGAGMEDAEDSGVLGTKMSVYIRAGLFSDDEGKECCVYPDGLYLEGLYMPRCYVYENKEGAVLNGLTIVKCRIDGISTIEWFEVGPKVTGMVVSQSKIDNIHFREKENDVLFRNCWINSVEMTRVDLKTKIIIDHCILWRVYSGTSAYYTNNIILHNCIPADAMAYNNILVDKDGISENAVGNGNWCGVETIGIFVEEGEDGSYAPGKKFALKYPKTYVGTDGTEVGINGGVTPWNPVASLPRIVSSKIDNRAAADGKINVSIKVEAQSRQ